MLSGAKVLILALLFTLSQATAVHNYPYYVNTGDSQQYRSQDAIGNYQFGYDEGHSSGGTFRKETGDAFGNKYGSYGLRDADGRYRVVNYIADAAGFRASVQSNEPGVAPADPASTSINKAVTVFTKTVPEPVTKTVLQPVTKTVLAPVTKTVQAPITEFAQAPIVQSQVAVPTIGNSLLYAPVIHHAASPDFPLLYQSPYQTPYGYYKGQAPYQAPYGYYKGSPYVRPSNYKGTPYTRYGYYIYP